MKKIVIMLLVVFLGAAGSANAQKKENPVVVFKSNMDCVKCEKTLTEYLKFEKGVKDLKVDHASNTIYIEYKDGKNSDRELAEAIEKKGYKADKLSIEDYKKLMGDVKKHGHDHGSESHQEK